VKAGFYGTKRVQRWKCQQCGKRLSEAPQRPFNADVRVPHEKVAMILHCLVEGNSVRSTARLCDVEKRKGELWISDLKGGNLKAAAKIHERHDL